MIQNATAYFKQLNALLLNVEVTDREGVKTSLDEGVRRAVAMILSTKANSAKVMVIGNGGSAAIASHMQNDLCKRVGLRAMVVTQSPLLTAIANDHGYDAVFEQPVALWGDPGDLLVAISCSGQSENILRAVRLALGRGCNVMTLSGFKADNALRRLGNLNIYVASMDYGYVESAHAVITHFLTDCAAVPPV